MPKHREAFLHYLMAAELGHKVGQTSLAWMLRQGQWSSPSPEAPSFTHAPGLAGRILGFLGVEGGIDAIKRVARALGRGAEPWSRALEDVAEAVREMGGDPQAMARRYVMLAARQGDGEAR